MNGRITGISGTTVRIEGLRGARMYDRVCVGEARLPGEIVRLDGDDVVSQVYEDTTGLGLGEPVFYEGEPLSVRLGPGLLGSIFDGLQRPLSELHKTLGPFLSGEKTTEALRVDKEWVFHSDVKRGDDVKEFDVIGFIDEGHIKHYLSVPEGVNGRVGEIKEGNIALKEPVAFLEDGREIKAFHDWPVRRPRPYVNKLQSSEPLITGQRILDFLFPVSKGGCAILPGGFGTGKTVLEQTIAKHAEADVIVYVGCGERGNEMAELLEDFCCLSDPRTGRLLLERTILIVNTSNMPVAAREASIYSAITIAEYYRDMGYNVLLLADSISRWAEALREISSSLEEMPGEEGYPTYLGSRLYSFYERAGLVRGFSGKTGSLTVIASVSPPGGDFTEPVTQACLRTAGAFWMLDTDLAHRRYFPAINWTHSFSLYVKDIAEYFRKRVSDEWYSLQGKLMEMLQKEKELKEISEIVGKEALQDSDRFLMEVAEIARTYFLCQSAYTEDAFCPPERACEMLKAIIDFYERGIESLRAGKKFEEIFTKDSISELRGAIRR